MWFPLVRRHLSDHLAYHQRSSVTSMRLFNPETLRIAILFQPWPEQIHFRTDFKTRPFSTTALHSFIHACAYHGFSLPCIICTDQIQKMTSQICVSRPENGPLLINKILCFHEERQSTKWVLALAPQISPLLKLFMLLASKNCEIPFADLRG